MTRSDGNRTSLVSEAWSSFVCCASVPQANITFFHTSSRKGRAEVWELRSCEGLNNGRRKSEGLFVWTRQAGPVAYILLQGNDHF